MHTHPIAPNLLARNFETSAPNEVSLTDVTCVGTAEGWLLLTAIIDLFARRVVGWCVFLRDRDHQDRRIVITEIAASSRATAASPEASDVRIAASRRTALSVATLETHRRDLVRIGLLTRRDRRSYIYLMGCLAGQGSEGSALVLALSRLWPGRYVVAYATTGYVEGGEMLRRGDSCTEPAMRDTGTAHSTFPELQRRAHGSRWSDLEALPWADQRSRAEL